MLEALSDSLEWWQWGIVSLNCLIGIVLIHLYWDKIDRKLQPKQKHKVKASPVSIHVSISQPQVTVTMPPWSKLYSRIRAMWIHWRNDDFNREGLTIKSPEKRR